MARKLQKLKLNPRVSAGAALKIAPSVNDRLRRELMALIRPIHIGMIRRIKSAWVRDFADAANDQYQPTPTDIRKLLTSTRKTAQELFNRRAEPIARRWLSHVSKSSKSSVKKSIEQLGLKQDLKELSPATQTIFDLHLTEAVGLIKTIPTEHFQAIEEVVRDSIDVGRGVAEVIPRLQERFGVTERRAKLIAFDQTRKAFSGLNQGLMQDAGVPRWRWIHSGGTSDPRPIHVALHGKVFTWDNPPIINDKGDRGFPADEVNCHCTFQPVI